MIPYDNRSFTSTKNKTSAVLFHAQKTDLLVFLFSDVFLWCNGFPKQEVRCILHQCDRQLEVVFENEARILSEQEKKNIESNRKLVCAKPHNLPVGYWLPPTCTVSGRASDCPSSCKAAVLLAFPHPLYRRAQRGEGS